MLQKLRGRGGVAHCIFVYPHTVARGQSSSLHMYSSFAIEALFFSFKGILIEDFMSG